MLELLTAISWASRVKTGYDLVRAKNWNDVGNIAVNCILTELLISQAKNNIRNQYQYRYYW